MTMQTAFETILYHDLPTGLRGDFLSSQKLLAAILLQKKSVTQLLATNIFMRIYIVKIVCECFLPLQESRPKPVSFNGKFL